MSKKKSDIMSADRKAAFVNTVCKRCQLCSPRKNLSPNFCMVVYEGDENRFLGFIHHVPKLQKSKPPYKLGSFEAFCGLFCNSFPPCPNKCSECSELNTRVACYSYFVNQWNQHVPQEVLCQIYELYSGTDLDELGKYLSFDLRKLGKKERKNIRASSKQTARIIGKAVAAVVSTKIYGKTRKEVNTSMFYNDNDLEWSNKITELLSKQENYDDETDD